ncbi:hypothetical protein BXZ70DRAFT_775259 [Cristinia sonorae]|uniref:F-box domain-containing protein n=1 Tax=Cristinia sonorae TaxID=1940300 RepID=A0A8K0UDS9_9AGAR|nr:hypothetical protein BXZ70DRAFT_775259 [Cristinia sonorae]
MKWSERADIKAIITELDSQATHRNSYQQSLVMQIQEFPEWETFVAAVDEAARLNITFNPQGFDKELCSIFREFQQVKNSANRIRAAVAELETLIAPLQFMPEEVLSLIFQLASIDSRTIPQQIPGYPSDGTAFQPIPLIIASVSRRWRCIALKTTALWANVYVAMARPKCWPQLAIQKSGKRKLEITIDCRANDCPNEARLDCFLSEILPHVGRWSAVSVVADHCKVLETIGIRLARLASPTLQEIRISLTGRGSREDQHITIPAIFGGGAPQLSRVRVDSVALTWNSPILTRLETLDLRWLWSDTKLSYHQFHDLMKVSPTLTTLVLRGFYVQLLPATNYDAIQAPSLRHLEISGDSVCAMLSLLVTPALNSLLLANVDESEFRVLGNFFQSSMTNRYPSLRSLTLLNVKTSKPTPGFLEVMSNIEDLTIINAGSEDFLAVLRARQEGDDKSAGHVMPAFPRLHNLTLLHDVDPETLLDMVRNRKEHKYPLESLIVHAGSLSSEFHQQLQQYLRVDGIYYRIADQ